MAFCAFETHKASNISEKHPSVIIDCCLFLSQKTSQLPKGTCFKVVQTKNWSMVSPYAAFCKYSYNFQNLNVSDIWGHTSLTISRPHFKTWTLYGEKKRDVFVPWIRKSTLGFSSDSWVLPTHPVLSHPTPARLCSIRHSLWHVVPPPAGRVKVKTPQDRWAMWNPYDTSWTPDWTLSFWN